MNLEEIKAELVEKHAIDIDAVTNQLSEAVVALAAKEAEVTSLIERAAALEASNKVEKVEALLESLISDGKSTQILNESYKILLNTLSYDEAKTFVDNLPTIIKTEQEGTPANDGTEVPEADKDLISIKALSEEKGISFSNAAEQFYADKYSLEKGE